MYIPKSFHTYYAQDAVISYLETGRKPLIADDDIPDALKNPQACFVSIFESNGRMRGCMGTIRPRNRWLYHEIVDNAIFAAFEDQRYTPLMMEELEDVRFRVETVTSPRKINRLEELDPLRYGIIVRSPDHKEGVLLPDCDGVVTVEDQITVAMKKGEIAPTFRDQLEILLFEIQVFH